MAGSIERFSEERKIEIISRLLRLTERQLEATQREEWDEWESLLAQKKEIYLSLFENSSFSLTQKDWERLHLIKVKEEIIKELLKSKEQEIIKELDHVRNFKKGLRGYRPSSHRVKLPRFLSKKI